MRRKIKLLSLHPQSRSNDSMNDLVAQLVEQMTLNHWVEGSSPSQVTLIKNKTNKNDSVAQLVEQMTLNHWVEGSSPSRVTKVTS